MSGYSEIFHSCCGGPVSNEWFRYRALRLVGCIFKISIKNFSSNSPSFAFGSPSTIHHEKTTDMGRVFWRKGSNIRNKNFRCRSSSKINTFFELKWFYFFIIRYSLYNSDEIFLHKPPHIRVQYYRGIFQLIFLFNFSISRYISFRSSPTEIFNFYFSHSVWSLPLSQFNIR